MMTLKSSKRVPLGQVIITPGAIVEFSADEVRECLLRHAEGDWGDLSHEDLELNDEALDNESRLLSRYVSKNGKPFWIITEWDRSVTTISVATWDRMVVAGKTPAPIYLSRGCVRWRMDDLRAWVAEGCPNRRSFESLRR